MQPKPGAIAVVRHAGRFLLVKRSKEPNAHTWGFPGGHVALGETALETAVRELAEETGVKAKAERYLTNLDVITRDGSGKIRFHYLLAVVVCSYQSGKPQAADDASDAGWFTPAEAATLRQSPNLQSIIDLLSKEG